MCLGGHSAIKKGVASLPPLFPTRLCESWNNQLLPERPAVLLPLRLLFFCFPSVEAEAPLEQHPADFDWLHEAPLVSVEADALLAQQPLVAALSLLHEPALASVEAEAPADLLQQPADLDLSQVALSPLAQEVLLASLAHVCSVFAFLPAGASVDWADTNEIVSTAIKSVSSFFMTGNLDISLFIYLFTKHIFLIFSSKIVPKITFE